jgi:hypothetical protein
LATFANDSIFGMLPMPSVHFPEDIDYFVEPFAKCIREAYRNI